MVRYSCEGGGEIGGVVVLQVIKSGPRYDQGWKIEGEPQGISGEELDDEEDDERYGYEDEEDLDDPAPNTDTNCYDGRYEDWPADDASQQ